MTGYRYLSGYLHNQYAITKEREYHDSIEVIEDGQRVKRDTVKVEYIPLMTFSHIFETNNSNRRYLEKTSNQEFLRHRVLRQQQDQRHDRCADDTEHDCRDVL